MTLFPPSPEPYYLHCSESCLPVYLASRFSLSQSFPKIGPAQMLLLGYSVSLTCGSQPQSFSKHAKLSLLIFVPAPFLSPPPGQRSTSTFWAHPDLLGFPPAALIIPNFCYPHLSPHNTQVLERTSKNSRRVGWAQRSWWSDFLARTKPWVPSLSQISRTW